MTLLKLLVKELPGRGGWPEAIEGVDLPLVGNDLVTSWRFNAAAGHFVACTYGGETVTRGQYEAAIAAQQPAWSGEGLPPVGCECEREVPRGWSRCRINYVSSSLIVYQMLDCGNEYASTLSAFKFRPIRTEAERKRDLAVGAMERRWESITGVPAYDFATIYDDIAAGKIPGVRLSDD